jgi:SAM-dependent methyltransferase
MALTEPKRVGVVNYRGSRGQSLNAWRKRTPLNPYWLDWHLLRQSVLALSEKASGVLLDVGVSEGPYRCVFEPVVDRYVGLEYPPSILDKQPDLWKILDRAKKSVDVFGDGNQLPFEDASFDTVLCTEVLEHLPDPASVLGEIARVLKPGGRLLATVPFSQPLHELPGDYYRFTPSGLEYLLGQAGLEVESITPRGNFASATGAHMSQFFLRWLGASSRQSDGSVILSRWRSALLLPFLALMQVQFHLISKFTSDTAVCHGYSVVAKRP